MKKLLAILFLLLVTTGCIFGQESFLKLIENGKYSKVDKKISKALVKKPYDIVLNFAMATLLAKRDYKGYNAEKAYEFLMRSKYQYENISDKGDIKSLNKIPINDVVFIINLDNICRCALNDASNDNGLKAYESFLSYYRAAPEILKGEATAKRNIVAYKIACDANTVESYQYFISSYSEAVQQNEAKSKRNTLAFVKAKSANTIQGYKDFINKYRDALEVKEAWIRVHELAFTQAEKENTSFAYKRFIDEYPNSEQFSKAFILYEKRQFSENAIPGNWKAYSIFVEKYPDNSWNSVAQDSIFALAIKSNNLEALKFCVDHMTDNKRNKALFYYHDIFTNDGERHTLDLFYNYYNDYILSSVKERDYELAALGDELMLYDPYNSKYLSKYQEYIQKAAPLEKAFVALQRIVSKDIKNKNWTSAAGVIKTYSAYFGQNNKKINDLIALLEAKWDNSIKVNSVGSGVNTIGGGEYAIVISADSKYLYFCGRDRKDNLGGEDIFVSKMKDGIWGKAKIISDLSFIYSHDAPSSVSTDGNTMIVFKSGELFYSDKYSQGWNEAIPFPKQINSGSWQADAMMTSDGNAMIFSCVREGGYNLNIDVSQYHGDNMYASDIYISTLDGNNQWSEPINLGPVINTPYCDRSPFIHPDMKTLYFSSDGHGGLGKLDVFKSTRLADTCWDCWSEPINMGKEINTAESDWGYKISTDGEKAYFAKKSTPDGSDDIYWLNLPIYLRPDFVVTISGKLKDNNDQPVSAEIRWEDLETGIKVGQSKSDPADGSYFIVLPLGKMYGYYVNKPEYYPLSNNVDLRNINQAREISEDITLVSYKQMVEDKIAVPINNLFFNFDESIILPTSIPELKRLANIIKLKNPKVEISGHTDSVGDDQYNQVLSEKRAVAVKDFLVNEGCNPDRLVTIGYGRSRPVESNESDAGRAKNRRVEIKFVS